MVLSVCLFYLLAFWFWLSLVVFCRCYLIYNNGAVCVSVLSPSFLVLVVFGCLLQMLPDLQQWCCLFYLLAFWFWLSLVVFCRCYLIYNNGAVCVSVLSPSFLVLVVFGCLLQMLPDLQQWCCLCVCFIS